MYQEKIMTLKNETKQLEDKNKGMQKNVINIGERIENLEKYIVRHNVILTELNIDTNLHDTKNRSKSKGH